MGTDLVRIRGLDGWKELVRELGGDPSPIARRFGITRSVLADPDGFLAYSTLARIIDASARELAVPDFGIRLADRQGPQILGPVAVVARHERTVHDALGVASRFLSHYSPAIRAEFGHVDDREAHFVFAIDLPGLFPREQITELSLAIALRMFRVVVDPAFRLRRVLLPHRPAAPLASHRRFFGCPVRSGEPYAALVVRRSDLDLETGRNDPEVVRAIAAYLESSSPAGGSSFRATLASIVERLVPTGRSDLRTVSALAGFHPRTLQRRLESEGLSFGTIVEAAKRSSLERLLAEPEIPLAQVSEMLGYSEQSALSRACRRWFGASPRTVRRRRIHESR